MYFKYFFGYKDNKKDRPLCIFFPEIRIHKKYFDQTKCMYFLAKDEKKISWIYENLGKVSNIMKKN